jgi:ATP adenylyltransferase
MKRIWASWRMKYISSADKQPGCAFCEALKKEDSEENLIVHRGKNSLIILNKYPYTSGHLMVAPLAHVANIEELDAETGNEIFQLITRSTTTLKKIYRPEGFNIGANLGQAAGAGIPGHLHFHIVPRWNGDTNYMSTIGEIRVIPEDIPVTYKRIKEQLHNSL